MPSGVSLDELKAIGPLKLHILRFNRRSMRKRTKDWISIIRPELDIWFGGIAIYRHSFRVGFNGSEREGDWASTARLYEAASAAAEWPRRPTGKKRGWVVLPAWEIASRHGT